MLCGSIRTHYNSGAFLALEVQPYSELPDGTPSLTNEVKKRWTKCLSTPTVQRPINSVLETLQEQWIPFSTAFLTQLSLKHSIGHRRNQRGDVDACHNTLLLQMAECRVCIPLIMHFRTWRMAPELPPKPFLLQWCLLSLLGWEMGVGYGQTPCWTNVFISGFWMKVSEDNKKKESVQVKIAIGMIFIFNFMSQYETVWQI